MNSTQLCDLHIHTCYSDGRAEPGEVVAQAARLGLRSIAITDHDNTRGSCAAEPIARQAGIELISGIEFTTRWLGCPTLLDGNDVDLLGYFMDVNQPDFSAVETAALSDIHLRVDECCQHLTAAGYPITLGEVFAENPHYAGLLQLDQALVRKGYHADQDEANRNVMNHWQLIRPGQLKTEEAIQAIHRSGGLAILAHPTLVPSKYGLLQAEEVARLVEMGLDGLEVYHYRLDAAARDHFLQIASKFNLAISGGSDEHAWPAGFPFMGGQPVDGAMVDALRQRLNQ
jgi:predicted metal-dependent phosphoesterase TrpH